MTRPRVAFYWLSSCGGCDESIVDSIEDFQDFARAVEVVLWPLVMDRRHADLQMLPDGGIDAVFVNGAVRTREHRCMAQMLRRKAKRIVAYGSCAHLGGVYGLANLHESGQLLRRSYVEAPTVSNPEERIPAMEPRTSQLPRLLDAIEPLDRVISVDCYVPGCPPPPELARRALEALFGDTFPVEATSAGFPPPEKGAVLAEKTALCNACPRKASIPETLKIRCFKRLHEVSPDMERCFLDQGLVCLGPATRGGCGARCIQGNMPCRGCFGPPGNVRDQGAKALSFLASLLESRDEAELEDIARAFPDPAGLLYRHSLPASLFRGRLGKPRSWERTS